VRQAQHQHGDDGHRRFVRRRESWPWKGVGAPSAGEPDPTVLADHQLQQRQLPARALLGAVGGERQPFGTGDPVQEPGNVRRELWDAAAAVPDHRPEELPDHGHGVAAGEELDQGLLGGGLGLGQQVEVTELALLRSDGVVVGHPPKLGGHVGPAAPPALDDGPHLLVAEPDIGAVAAAVVDVVDHVRRIGAGRDVHEQAAPARPVGVGVGDLVAAHHQRRADLVVRQIEPGAHPEDIAQALGMTRAAVYSWLAKYRQGGLEALRARPVPGRPPTLSGAQLARLYHLVVGNDPRQLRFAFALWTRAMIRELIRPEFGVRLSEVSVGRLLRKLGLSPQRPLYRAYQQNPEAVARWKAETYPQIRAEAAATGGTVYFADEAGVRSDYHAGTTWAPVGKTPMVAATGDRLRST
jgi:transposase